MPRQRQRHQKPKQHQATSITISNYASGGPFTYTDQDGINATSARVKGKTTLVWATAPKAPFILYFADDVTYGGTGKKVHPSDGNQQVKIKFRGRKPNTPDKPNTYSYDTVVVKKNIPIVDDPEMIIDD